MARNVLRGERNGRWRDGAMAGAKRGEWVEMGENGMEGRGCYQRW
ncbi:hypothetical protein [Bartonella tribocorum]|nr:hypothetical protein [Bartonella tribocorum]